MLTLSSRLRARAFFVLGVLIMDLPQQDWYVPKMRRTCRP